MHIRPKVRAQLLEVLQITIFWIACGLFLAFYKCVTYDTVSGDFAFIVPKGYPLETFVLINLIGPLIGGIIGGYVLVVLINDRMRNRSYGYFMIVSLLFFLAFILILNTTVSYIFYYREETGPGLRGLLNAIPLLFTDPYAIRNVVTWAIIAFMTLQWVGVNEKYGPGVLWAMVLGKYHRPHEVDRVFMFLDLSNSTAIAEKIGHVNYFSLIRDFIADATDPVLNSKGEIYQYVGDEIIVSWSLENAITEEVNCIACFFDIGLAITHKRQYYLDNYGLVPEFKAAVHCGEVVVGELGVIKREIVFSGDILNTAARMMEQCKVFGETLIVSRKIVDRASGNALTRYEFKPLGPLSLRGKTQEVELFGVRLVNV